MRIIPKASKVKLTFYRGVTIPDMIIGFVGLALVAITLSTNFPFRFYIAIGILCLIIPLYIKVNDERLYEYIGFFFRFLVSKKSYSKNSKIEASNIASILPYDSISDGVIHNKDGTIVGVMEIEPIDFDMLTSETQDEYIDGVFSRILNNLEINEEFQIVKLEQPLILDDELQGELNRVNNLCFARSSKDITQDEYEPRVDLCQSRMELIDMMNSNDYYHSTYYLCLIGVNANEIKEKLNRAILILRNGKMNAHVLKDDELVAFVKYSYDSSFDERKVKKLKPEEYKDLFAPESIHFSVMSTKLNNNKSVSQFVINNYPLRVPNAWGERLFDLENTKVVMRLKPVERDKAIKRIDNAILELQTRAEKNKLSEQFDQETHLDTLEDLMKSLKEANENLFDTTIMITVYDELGKNINKKKVKTALREMGFGFTEMLGRQMDFYLSNYASKYDKTNISQGIQTSTIAGAFPFVSNALLDKQGIFIGNNTLPMFVNFFKRDSDHVNSNMIVIGQSGSGKSYATKTILTGLASDNSKVYILDPENEYGALARNLEGKSLDVASGADGKINPFQIITCIEEGEENNSFYLHLQFLEQFYRLILPGINADSLELLNKLTQELYESFNINSSSQLTFLSSSDYPIFDDLYNLINNKLLEENDDYTKSCLRVLINYISKLKKGGRNSNLWNGPTSFSPKENFVVFNFQKLLANKNDVIANAQMLLVLKWLENEIIKNRDFNLKYHTSRKLVVAIDEAHLFIDEKYPIALDFMFQLAKRIRKYDGMMIIITQNVKDFTGTPDIARKSMAIINVSQYSMIFNLSANDMTDLRKLYENAGGINDTEANTIVHNIRGRAFFISSVNRRTNVSIQATQYAENLFEKENKQ